VIYDDVRNKPLWLSRLQQFPYFYYRFLAAISQEVTILFSSTDGMQLVLYSQMFCVKFTTLDGNIAIIPQSNENVSAAVL